MVVIELGTIVFNGEQLHMEPRSMNYVCLDMGVFPQTSQSWHPASPWTVCPIRTTPKVAGEILGKIRNGDFPAMSSEASSHEF